MKKTTVFTTPLMMFGLIQFGWGQLLNENFNYTTGANITDNGWSAFSASGTQPITVSSGGLSFTGYASSGIGNAALLDNTGEDDKKSFTEQTSGTVYASFLVNVATDGAPSGYFFHFRKSSSNKGRVFVKKVSSNLEFGLSKNSNTGTYTSNSYDFDTAYLLVLKYEFKAGDDEVSLYVFSSGDNFSSEPGSPTLGTLTDGTDFSGIDYVALRQYSASQNITVDGIRVGTSWGDAPLPVELTSFTATPQKGSVKLSWVTESEIDNLGFLLERSLIPSSGFTTIADYRFVPELQGQGSVTSRTNYSYMDKEVVPGTKYYYVLSDVTSNPEHGEPVTRHTDKMVSATPKWRAESSALIKEFKTFMAYPNPFNSKTVIAYELEDVRELSISIVDINGRQVTKLYNGFQASGFHELSWHPQDISAGIYFCRLTSGGNNITRKIVLLK